MRKMLLAAAAALTLLAGSAYAQGNAPYNSSGMQAGGPLGGRARAAQGAAMESGAAPRPMMRKRMMMRHHRRMMKMRHHRRMMNRM